MLDASIDKKELLGFLAQEKESLSHSKNSQQKKKYIKHPFLTHILFWSMKMKRTHAPHQGGTLELLQILNTSLCLIY